MSFIDYIKKIIGTNKKNARFITTPFTKTYGDSEPLEVALFDNDKPITQVDVGIAINNKKYIKKTDCDGIAQLNINLPPDEYTAKLYYPGDNEYNAVTGYCEVFVKANTYMEGTEVYKVQGDPTDYQCALYNSFNGERIHDEVIISINGREYRKRADDSGLYHLSINLLAGSYTITATFMGNDLFNSSSVMNNITVNEKPSSTDTSISNKEIILGCDSNTDNDLNVQNDIANKLRNAGYSVNLLPIGPNFFAECDYSSYSAGKIGIYLIASGIFSIGDAAYGSGQFSNYVFGIRGDFGDRGATNFDIPIHADADCNWVCDKLDGKTFNEMNAMLQPYIAICGGANSEELANNIIDWVKALEHKKERPVEQEENTYVRLLNYFEDAFGECKYIDDALEKIQGRGYAFYFSDGYNVYQTVDNIANGNGANCYDASELFYRLALGMNIKYGRNYQPEYLDVWCPVSGYDHIRLRFKVGDDYFYRDVACVLSGGEIDENWCGTSENILEVNPSWILDG